MVVVDNSVIIDHLQTTDKSSAFAIVADDNMASLFKKSDSSSSGYKFYDIFYEVGEKLRKSRD